MASGDDDAQDVVRKAIYGGEAIGQLYVLRKNNPHLAAEVDGIVVALKAAADAIESYLGSRAAPANRISQLAGAEPTGSPDPVRP
jgi:hypothetical protein